MSMGLRELVLNDLRSRDDDAKAAFDREFGTDLPAFVDATTEALDVWSQFRDGIKDTDERRVAVTAVAFTASVRMSRPTSSSCPDTPWHPVRSSGRSWKE